MTSPRLRTSRSTWCPGQLRPDKGRLWHPEEESIAIWSPTSMRLDLLAVAFYISRSQWATKYQKRLLICTLKARTCPQKDCQTHWPGPTMCEVARAQKLIIVLAMEACSNLRLRGVGIPKPETLTATAS